MELVPFDQAGEDFFGLGSVAYEVVVNNEDMVPISEVIQGFEFRDDLIRGFIPLLATVEMNDVAEFTVKGAAAGDLQRDVRVVLKSDQVVAGDG